MLLQLEITTRFKPHSSRYDEGFMVFLSSTHECSETSHHRYHRNLLLFTSHGNFIITFATIQSDSGWKVSILWGDSIGQCEKKKSSYEHVIPNGYQDTAVLIYQYNTIVNDNKEWEVTVDFIWILISCLNEKFVRHKWQICYSSQ
jgi:hypothetical protein